MSIANPAPTLLHLDPNALASHPTNVRADLGDLKSLAASITELGVLEPVVVCPVDDGHRILAGHRRNAASILAGLDTVPVIVRSDLSGDIDQVLAMVVENEQRQDLKASEIANAYQQLSAFGLSAATIGKRTGTKLRRVKDALTVAGSEVASTVAERFDLNLDQALVLAEFDDDTDAIKELTIVAKKTPGQFDHAAARLRQDREERNQRDAVCAELVEAGVTVIDSPRSTDKAQRVDRLADAKAKAITPSRHTKCPGHAAAVSNYAPYLAPYYCTDPEIHNHQPLHQQSSSSERTGPMSDADKAERRVVIENNKAWKAATEVRLTYVRRLLAQRTAPKSTLRFVATEILVDPNAIGLGDDATLADLIADTTEHSGHGRQVGATLVDSATDARLPLVLLAQVAARYEKTMGTHTWRHRHPDVARYLTWLASTGYTVAPIEQHVIDTAAAKR